MKDMKPYLINAVRECILDSSLTPYVLCKAAGSQVPLSHVKDGMIVLNIRPAGVKDLFITEHGMVFETRFGGVAFAVHVPLENILAIYPKENPSEGMRWVREEVSEATPAVEQPKPDAPPPKAGLRVVK